MKRGKCGANCENLWFEDEERAVKILAIHNFLDINRWQRRR
ncbi:MAG: hypothetical protein QXO47_09490 [Thermoproteota archaeon]